VHKKRIAKLLRVLAGSGKKERKEAVSALIALGSGAVRSLSEALYDPNDRNAAADALSKIGRAGVTALIEALKGDDKRAIAMKNTFESGEELITKYEPIQICVAHALGNVRNPSSLVRSTLIEALTVRRDQRDFYPNSVRAAVAGTLGKLGKAGLPALVQALENEAEFHDVRENAARALGRIGASVEAVAPILVRVLNRPFHSWDSGLRISILYSLSAIGDRSELVFPALISSLKDRELRKTSMEILERIGSLWIPNLKIVCRQVDREVREAAIQILAKIDPNAFDPDSIKREITAEEKRVLGWFESGDVDLQEYLQHLQVFWCIGVVERTAFESGGQALGYNKLTLKLRMLSPHFNLIPLPTGANHICGTCLPDLDGLFDREPFFSASWSDHERGLPLRDEFMRGERKESCWTPKARKAWSYVDCFLTIRGYLPQIMAPESCS
jgi:HEAT repeat protein